MANQLNAVQNAKVVKVGQYSYGNGNNGPWAKLNVKLEYEVEITDASNEKKVKKDTIVVTFWNEKAKWAKDFVKAGNPFAEPAVPDMFLDVWFRTRGDLNERNNGSEFIDNINSVEYCSISEDK